MALSLYIGPPGSGKSYEAVASVLIPAFQAGRTIVTNIKGVRPEYWSENLEPAKGCSLGTIQVVDEEFFHNELHYPLMTRAGGVVEAGAIPAGALVVIDEAHEVFPGGAGSPVTKRMTSYIRTHRHFVDDDGIASDMVLISQDAMSLHPRIRSVAEFCTDVRNMRYLGFGRRYRMTVYTSPKMTRTTRLGTSYRKYRLPVFDFYKSFEADGAAKVVMTDKSQRLVKWYHWLFAAVAVFALAFGIYRAFGTYEGMTNKEAQQGVSAIGAKRECRGSGILIDLTDRRALVGGEWRKVDASSPGPDGRTRWDVGPCYVTFGAGAAS